MEAADLLNACVTGDTGYLERQDNHDIGLSELRYCRTPLHVALDRGHANMVKILLEKGAEANRYTKLWAAPLTLACERGAKLDSIKLLLGHGAQCMDSDTTQTFATNILETACSYCDADVIGAIINGNLRINTTNTDTPLHIAARRGMTEVCRELIRRNVVPIDGTNGNGRQPIHEACARNHSEVVKLLLEFGAKVERVDNGGDSCLSIALKNGNCELVSLLLDHGGRLGDVAGHLRTAYSAFNAGLVQILLECGGSVDNLPPTHLACLLGQKEQLREILCTTNKNSPDLNGQTVLHLAIKKRQIELVDICLSYGVDCNICDRNNETALHIATKIGDEILVERLLQYGATAEFTNRHGCSPFEISCSQGRLDILKLLAKSTSDTEPYLRACFDTAIKSNHIEIVRYLLSSTTIKLRIKPDEAHSLVMHACEQGNHKIVDLLIDEGLTSIEDVRKLFPQGITQLCWNGRIELFQWLWNIGVSVNSRLEDNRTALHFASQYGLPSATHALLQTGANVNVQDTSGQTALHLACSNNHLPICKYLVNGGARLSIPDNEGVYPIHLASGKGSVELVSFLLGHGADAVSPSRNGSSPLHYAAKGGNLYSVLKLIANGGNPNLRNNFGASPMAEAANGLLNGAQSKTVLRSTDSARTIVFTTGVEVLELLLCLGADPAAKDRNGLTVYQTFLQKTVRDSGRLIVEILDNEINAFIWDILQDFHFAKGDLNQALSLLNNNQRYSDRFLVSLIQAACGVEDIADELLITHVQKCGDPRVLLEGVHTCAIRIPHCQVMEDAPGVCFHPTALTNLCRAAIRRILRCNHLRLTPAVHELLIPMALRLFLLFDQ